MKAVAGLRVLKLAARVAALLFAIVVGVSFVLAYQVTLADMHHPVAMPDGLFDAQQTLRFKSSDGLTLSGIYIPGRSEHPGIVLCHGVGANRLQMLDQAWFLSREGYPLLMFDFRNHGESEGSRTSYGYYEWRDVAAAVAALLSRIGGERVVLWGISMGAATALISAPRVEGLAGVIAESPFDTLEATMYHHNGLYTPLPDWPTVPLVLAFMRLMGDYDTHAVAPIHAVSEAKELPMLFVSGADDTRMPPALVARIAAAHGPRTRLFSGNGSHALVFQRSGDAYKKAVLEFLAWVDPR